MNILDKLENILKQRVVNYFLIELKAIVDNSSSTCMDDGIIEIQYSYRDILEDFIEEKKDQLTEKELEEINQRFDELLIDLAGTAELIEDDVYEEIFNTLDIKGEVCKDEDYVSYFISEEYKNKYGHDFYLTISRYRPIRIYIYPRFMEDEGFYDGYTIYTLITNVDKYDNDDDDYDDEEDYYDDEDYDDDDEDYNDDDDDNYDDEEE